MPPLSIPLTENFKIDTRSLKRLIEFRFAAGVHGRFVLESTSETVFLADEQRAIVLDIAVRTVAGQVPVPTGTIDTTSSRVTEHALAAQHARADELVVTAPFYIRVRHIACSGRGSWPCVVAFLEADGL